VGFLWDLSDGRRLAVTHQPMEDGGWVSTFQDITERRRLDEQMAYLAQHDTLTGLPNRAFFQDRLERALALVRSGQKLALLCLDLDQFKAVNDTLGHAVGDVLLQAVARRLQTHIRGTDTFARLGGDEFAIILAVTDRPAIAAVFADRVIDALHTPFDVDGQQIVIGTSI